MSLIKLQIVCKLVIFLKMIYNRLGNKVCGMYHFFWVNKTPSATVKPFEKEAACVKKKLCSAQLCYIRFCFLRYQESIQYN